MTSKEMTKIRAHLGKTQAQMAQLLSASIKTVQSYEQGWRNIPPHVERQLFFLLAMKKTGTENVPHCWDTKDCPPETREECPAWEFNVGQLCWFINGTICNAKVKRSWKTKMRTCRQCEVFQSVMPAL